MGEVGLVVDDSDDVDGKVIALEDDGDDAKEEVAAVEDVELCPWIAARFRSSKLQMKRRKIMD